MHVLTGATMRGAGKIGRVGRAAIVAAVSAAFVLLAIPAANAGNDWEIMPKDAPTSEQTVSKIKKIDTLQTDLDQATPR
jgi:hypothetical protein